MSRLALDVAAPSVPPPAVARRRITVVHMIHTMAYGGVETIVINWVRALDRSRFQTHIVCFANPDNTEAPFVTAARRVGLDVTRIPWGRRKPVLGAARRLAGILRNVRADVLHTHNVYANLVGVIAARLVRVASVASLYVWSDFGWKRNLLQAVDRRALRYFDVITTQCEATQRRTLARGLPVARVRVLPAGIEPVGVMATGERAERRRAAGIADDEVLLINAARLYPEKAQDFLLRCFRRIRDQCAEARLWILGIGPLEGPLRAMCRSFGLEDSVRFAGFAEDLVAQLMLADVQVHPARDEGVPLAVCAGMGVGLPIVASAVGGLPEILESDRGVLVRSDDESAFVEAVVGMIRDPARRRQLGLAARAFIESEYSLASTVGRLEEIYHGLAGDSAVVSPIV